MNTPRAFAGAITLPSGDVLVVGGHLGYSSIDTAEIYSVASGKWSYTPEKLTRSGRREGRQNVNLNLLPDGRVHVMSADTGYEFNSEI